MVHLMPVVSFLYSGLEICLKLFWGTTVTEWKSVGHRLHTSFDKAVAVHPELRPLCEEIFRDFEPLGWTDPSGLLRHGMSIDTFLKSLFERWESIRYWGMDERMKDEILVSPIDPYLLLDLWKAAFIVLFERADDSLLTWRECELARRDALELGVCHSAEHSDRVEGAAREFFKKKSQYLREGGSSVLGGVLMAKKAYVDKVAQLEPGTAALNPGEYAFDIHSFRKEAR